MTEREQNLINYLKFESGAISNLGGARKDWAYSSVSGFYLAKGHLFPRDPLTAEEEATLLTVLARHGMFKSKECYGNAAQLAIPVGSCTCPLTYCEGYALGWAIIPVQHAWVSLNGKPVDVTWRKDWRARNTRNPKRVLERIKANIQGCAYYGVEVEARRLSKHIVEAGTYSPVVEGKGFDFAPVRTGVL